MDAINVTSPSCDGVVCDQTHVARQNKWLLRALAFVSFGFAGMTIASIVLACKMAGSIAHRHTLPEYGPPSGSTIASKAFATLVSTDKGPDPMPANANLKIMATSSGLMPQTAPVQVDAYKKLASSVAGRGVLYLLDAKMLTLQFALTNADPDKHNQQTYVPYRRVPDEPGGKPIRDASGHLVVKTQGELLSIGYATAEYALRHNGHYSNGHLSIIGDEDAPVYLSYLYYDHEIINGQPQYKILLAKGHYKDGIYTAQQVDGKAFEDRDYEETYEYNSSATRRFAEVSTAQFADVVTSVRTVMSCGGDTFLTIQALSPYFHDGGGAKMLASPNPYGRSVLDRVRDGKVVYVGQSAGTVALSYGVGSLTEDSSFPELLSEEVVNMDYGLGVDWLLPRIGEYLGIPYRLVFRPHLRFDIDSCAFEDNVLGLDRVSASLSGAVNHDVYGVIMADYDFSTGKGDCVEISDGKVYYHISYTDEEMIVSEAANKILDKFSPWWTYKSESIRVQPLGNPAQGRTFEWQPSDGEVFAAGPWASMPFHLYSSTLGPFIDAPPLKDSSVEETRLVV
jgi:hypothetical protein